MPFIMQEGNMSRLILEEPEWGGQIAVSCTFIENANVFAPSNVVAHPPYDNLAKPESLNFCLSPFASGDLQNLV